VVFPIRRQEPFGLVMIEAMATGTLVVAYSNGAVPEIVVNGRTGYVVDPKEIESGNYSGFINAGSSTDRISREECRRHVQDNFSIERQAKDYISVYGDMISKVYQLVR